MNRKLIKTVAIAVVAGTALLSGNANSASLLEKNFWLSGPRYDGVIPGCEWPGALERISYQFAQKESRFWNSALSIVGFERLREVAFIPWGGNTIPRRFCTGYATVSDGKKTRVNYYIGEDTGLIGASYGVTWCVVGYDRNWAYEPGCRMAMP